MLTYEQFEEAFLETESMTDVIELFDLSGILADPMSLEIYVKSLKDCLAENIQLYRMQINLLQYLNGHRAHPQSHEDMIRDLGIPDHEHAETFHPLA